MEPKLEDYMDWPKIEDLEYAECGNPQEVLGAAVVDGHVLLRCYFPDAEKVSVKVKGVAQPIAMAKMEEGGLKDKEETQETSDDITEAEKTHEEAAKSVKKLYSVLRQSASV